MTDVMTILYTSGGSHNQKNCLDFVLSVSSAASDVPDISSQVIMSVMQRQIMLI